MTETVENAVDPGQLVKLSTVAASNIAKAIGVGEEHVASIEQAIEDEFAAMSSHFVLAFSDIQHQFEQEKENLEKRYAEGLAQIESGFNFAEKNLGMVLLISGIIFLLGALIGHNI